jgi:alpha-glucosidase
VHPALAVGSLRLLEAEGDVLAYTREYEGETIVVALNLGSEPHHVKLPEGRPLLSTAGDYQPGVLAPNQGLTLEASV